MTQEIKPQLAQVSIMDSMSRAKEIWVQNFLVISLAVIIVYIPNQVIIELISIPLDNAFPDDLESLRMKTNVYDGIRGLIGIIASLGVINFVFQVMRGNEENSSATDIVLHGLNKWPIYFIASLYAGLKVILYMLMLLIPGIYKGVRLSFVDCLSTTDNLDYSQTCNKSESMVEGRWWYIFAFILFIFVLEAIVEILVALPFFYFSENQIVTGLMGILIRVITIYFVIVKAVYFFELLKLKSDELEASQDQSL